MNVRREVEDDAMFASMFLLTQPKQNTRPRASISQWGDIKEVGSRGEAPVEGLPPAVSGAEPR